ncbi:MAG: gliding motility-associated C-terminal domain-containing protein [Bacteroidota bacterium]|nr:gliding motility-associated C-terminal domain-containing protein [Bacteroidota bacterium]
MKNLLIRSSILCTALMFLVLIPVKGQLDAGKDDTISPGVPVTLTAHYGEVGIPVITSDDGVEGPFPIGFSFNFFGTNFTEFYISANGWISFSPNNNSAGRRQPFIIPSAADYDPKNCILGPFQDLNPVIAGSPYIFYLTTGEQPNRKLIVMWCQTPMFGCVSSYVTFQIILNEGSNTIENQIFQKPACPEWQDNEATMGVQNSNGYTGYAVPGRNATSWEAFQEGWKYIPTSVDSFQIVQIPYNLQPLIPGDKILYRWYQDGNVISYEPSVTVAPHETTRFIVVVDLCDGQEYSDTVTVHVISPIPNAFRPGGNPPNNRFRITGVSAEDITDFQLQIFNRWGQIVFSTTDISQSWDGTMKNQDCPEGEYIWAISYRNSHKKKVTNKGTVLLLR